MEKKSKGKAGEGWEAKEWIGGGRRALEMGGSGGRRGKLERRDN